MTFKELVLDQFSLYFDFDIKYDHKTMGPILVFTNKKDKRSYEFLCPTTDMEDYVAAQGKIKSKNIEFMISELRRITRDEKLDQIL